MNNFIKYFFFSLLIFFSTFTFSQNETNKWYFGQNAGLDFSTNPPTALNNGSVNATRGSSSISDANGNLLFYTDGQTVWNQNHAVMSNGTGLFGNSGHVYDQTNLIVKQPGNSNLYYIFTAGGNNSLCYSLVDMNLSAGTGSVISKNVLIYSFGGTQAALNLVAGTKHCNGTDYWIVTSDFINTYAGSSIFKTFLFTSSGISTVPITQIALGTHGPGSLKFSSNGKKLAAASYVSPYNPALGWPVSWELLEIYDFNNSTGAITNGLALINGSSVTATFNYSQPFGTEFSPDGNKIYCSLNGVSTPSCASCINTGVLQWDLCAGSNSAIVASVYTVSSASCTNEIGTSGALQLASNGKIYISNNGTQSLSVINNPNGQGSSCNFSLNAQSVGTGTCTYGLPNFVSSNFIQLPNPGVITYSMNNTFTCQAGEFHAPPIVQNPASMGCSTNGYSVSSFLWNFGDPSSAASNTSTSANPIHVFSNLGTYTVSLILYYSCGGLTDTLTQVVNVNQLCLSVAGQSITCATLGSATISSSNGVGPITYTWMPGNYTGSLVTGLAPGFYTVTGYDAGSNVTSTTSIVFTSPVPLTGSVNPGPMITCHGANTGSASIINIAGGSANQTFLWSNGSLSFTGNPITSLSAGLWTVTVTDLLTACQFNQFFSMSQASALSLTLSANSTTACVGSSCVLSGSNSGGTAGYTYTWTAGPASNTTTISEIASGTYIYTLSSFDAHNCLTSNTIVVDFIPYPVLSTSNVFICPLAIGTLTVSGATNYTWSSPSTTALSTGNSFTDAPLSTQQYTVVGEALGCSSQTMASLVLYNSPNATLFDNGPRCNGDLLSLNGFGGVSYVWSGPNSFTSAVQTNSINPVSLVNAGVYNLTVTAATGCTASISKTVVVNPTPPLSAIGSTVCTSQTLNLSASSFTGSTYLWNGPPNFTSTLQNPFINNPLTTNTGTYTVKVTSALGCTNIAIATASVALPPSLTAQLSSNTLCSQAFNGSPNTITLTAGGANTYTLVTVPDMFNANPGGPVSPLTAIPPNTGIASATLSGSNGVCTVTTGLTFSIIPNPSITVSSPTPVICAGDTYTYTNNGASSYTWSSSTPGFTTYNNGGVAVSNPSINSVFSVFGGSLGCNSASKTSSITVNPLPVFSISPGTPTICLNNKITLNINGNATSYTWSPYVGLNSNIGATVSAFPTSLQTYTALGSLNSCTNTALITVSVLSLPSPTAIALNPELCLNELITLQGYGGETYRWDGPIGLMYAGQTVTFVARSRTFSGTYTLTVSDISGCMASNQVGVKINPLPNADLSISKQNGCVPFTSKFSMYTQGVNDTNIVVYWQLDNQTFYGKQFSYLFSTAKTYSIFGYYSDTLTTCKNSATYIVEAYPLPKADFMVEPEKPVEGLDEVYFMNTSSGDELSKFNWYFINNQGYQSENKNTSYLFNELGEYPVAMVVQNKWGCADTMIKSIKVEADFNVYVPNAFTPNEDNLNDVFLPILRGVKLYELMIFDRWGKRIFLSNQIESGWDGYYNGEPAKNDVYTWKINLSTNSGEMKSLNGHLILSR